VSKKEKIVARLLTVPSDFTWDELVTALKHFGYKSESGDGSRVKFKNGKPEDMISLHKPHSPQIVKQYLLRQVIEKLQNAGYLP
jgi:predicted RNA binding protein YcfA (HicA-like mRNA interferase family)